MWDAVEVGAILLGKTVSVSPIAGDAKAQRENQQGDRYDRGCVARVNFHEQPFDQSDQKDIGRGLEWERMFLR